MTPEIPPPQVPVTAPPDPGLSARATLAWLRDLSLSVVIAIIVILFLYQPVKVEGTSMMPALGDQERIFINKFGYRFGRPIFIAATRWCSASRGNQQELYQARHWRAGRSRGSDWRDGLT